MIKNKIKPFIFKVIVWAIRKYFSEKISFDESEEIYKWSWTKDVEDAVSHREKGDSRVKH